MAKPDSKQALSKAIQTERRRLARALEKCPPDAMEMPRAYGYWSVKELHAHLLDWKLSFLGWYRAGLQGDVPKTPHDRFNWRELPTLNQVIFEKFIDWSLEGVQNAKEQS